MLPKGVLDYRIKYKKVLIFLNLELGRDLFIINLKLLLRLSLLLIALN